MKPLPNEGVAVVEGKPLAWLLRVDEVIPPTGDAIIDSAQPSPLHVPSGGPPTKGDQADEAIPTNGVVVVEGEHLPQLPHVDGVVPPTADMIVESPPAQGLNVDSDPTVTPQDAIGTTDRQAATFPTGNLIIEGESLAKLSHIPNVASPQGERLKSPPNDGGFVVDMHAAAVSSPHKGVVIVDETTLGAATTTFTVDGDPTILPVLSLLTAKSDSEPHESPSPDLGVPSLTMLDHATITHPMTSRSNPHPTLHSNTTSPQSSTPTFGTRQQAHFHHDSAISYSLPSTTGQVMAMTNQLFTNHTLTTQLDSLDAHVLRNETITKKGDEATNTRTASATHASIIAKKLADDKAADAREMAARTLTREAEAAKAAAADELVVTAKEEDEREYHREMKLTILNLQVDLTNNSDGYHKRGS